MKTSRLPLASGFGAALAGAAACALGGLAGLAAGDGDAALMAWGLATAAGVPSSLHPHRAPLCSKGYA